MTKVDVFISWSGDRSLAIAEVVKAWLLDVARNVSPWLSRDDLRKGLLWLPELSNSLRHTAYGVLILTPENQHAPWLAFEAGAISHALPERCCSPVLCDLRNSDLSGPFAQFQATTIRDRADMLRFIKSINAVDKEDPVDEPRLEKWFDRCWDEFSADIERILASDPGKSVLPVRPSQQDLLEQILELVRNSTVDPRQVRARFGDMDGVLHRIRKDIVIIRRMLEESQTRSPERLLTERGILNPLTLLSDASRQELEAFSMLPTEDQRRILESLVDAPARDSHGVGRFARELMRAHVKHQEEQGAESTPCEQASRSSET